MEELKQGRVEGVESLLKIAAIQFEPLLAQGQKNQNKILELTGKAFDQGAQLVVVPELATSGFVYNSRSEALENAEPIPGTTVNAIESIAKDKKGYIVCGVLEKEGDIPYNTGVLVGPKGYKGGTDDVRFEWKNPQGEFNHR